MFEPLHIRRCVVLEYEPKKWYAFMERKPKRNLSDGWAIYTTCEGSYPTLEAALHRARIDASYANVTDLRLCIIPYQHSSGRYKFLEHRRRGNGAL